MGIRATLILYIGVIITINAEINITKLVVGTEVEIVEYADGKHTTQVVEDESLPYYTPTNSSLKLELKPKIITSQYGTMYLYDLARGDKYLNALSHRTLRIKGDIDTVHISIADKAYFDREDNIRIELQNSSYDLSSLYKRLDLMRLKYLVVIDRDNKREFQIDSILFESSDTRSSMQTTELSTWSWSPEKLDADILITHNISNIYLQSSDKLEDGISKISDTNITIYGLNGSASDIYNYEHLKQDIALLSNLKTKYRQIVGYQVDIEPYLLEDFKTQEESIWRKYLETIETLQHLCRANGLRFSVVVPFWIDSKYIDDQNLAYKIANIADEIVIMAYRSDLDRAYKLSKNILSIGDITNTRVSIGLELMHIDDEKHTRYIVHKDSNTSKPTLQKSREYTVKGSNISFYKQLDRLQDLREHPIPHTSFGGFTLHHFSVLPLKRPF